jgi:hypothetical protein
MMTVTVILRQWTSFCRNVHREVTSVARKGGYVYTYIPSSLQIVIDKK